MPFYHGTIAVSSLYGRCMLFVFRTKFKNYVYVKMAEAFLDFFEIKSC